MDRQFRAASRGELLPFLVTAAPGMSRKQAKDLLRFRAVSVTANGIVRRDIRHDTILEPGDLVIITARNQARVDTLERHKLKIVHLDDAIVVIDKPAGLLSMGSPREKEKTAHRILNEHLKALAKSLRQQVFIVHRLDSETSGLMLLARSESVQAALQRNWKTVTKKYLAVVEGTPPDESATLRDYLAETKSLVVHRVERGGGELAITHYRVIEKRPNRSLLELTLETGRKNQIRVQLAALGNPVVGDRKYGASSDPARRLALHSCELRFRHPVSGTAMQFASALPSNLTALIERRTSRAN